MPASLIDTRSSVGLQNIGDEGAREIAREAVDGRGVFLKKATEIARQLVLIVEKIGGILEENFSLPVGQSNFYADGDQGADGASGGGVVGKRIRRSR